MWNSSNPALNNNDAFKQMYGDIAGGGHPAAQPATATVGGVVNKTAMLIIVAVGAGALAYAFVPTSLPVLTVSAIAAFILCLGGGFLLAGKPQLSPFVAPVFAIVEGVFLGSLTKLLDELLISQGKGTEYLALQAFTITIGVTVAMLALYAARIIRPTRAFRAIVGTLVGGIAITYMLMFALSFFGIQLPFIALGSAMQGGAVAWIGLGLNVVILGVASLTLIMDFALVENRVAAGSPKYMEWYCGFALLVTIAWIYYEAVKLAFRIQMLLRD